MQILYYLHRQGFCKKAKENLIIGEAFQSIRAAGAPLLFDLLSSFFSPRSGLLLFNFLSYLFSFSGG